MSTIDNDTAAATAPRPPGGLNTEVVVGAILIGALLLLATIRVAFGGAVIQIGD